MANPYIHEYMPYLKYIRQVVPKLKVLPKSTFLAYIKALAFENRNTINKYSMKIQRKFSDKRCFPATHMTKRDITVQVVLINVKPKR